MSAVVDFHSHVLPCVDDGSRSLEESLAMLRAEAEQGIRTVVATPHFYPGYDTPERFLRRRAEAAALLREKMEQQEQMPRLLLGAEVYFFSGISESSLLSQLTIEEKKCILLEMPEVPWTESMYRELEGIYIKQGFTPVIAHVDRYIRPFKTYGIPQRLAELPVLVQANASFFLRRSTASMALRLLREGKIQLLGSDCHNMEFRPPNLGQAVSLIARRLGPEMLEYVKACQDDLLQEL